MRDPATAVPDLMRLVALCIKFHLLREVPHGISAMSSATDIGVGTVENTGLMKRALIWFQFEMHRPIFVGVKRPS